MKGLESYSIGFYTTKSKSYDCMLTYPCITNEVFTGSKSNENIHN